MAKPSKRGINSFLPPAKRDPEKVPAHMQQDEKIRNKHIDAGDKLCPRCDGTQATN